MPAPRGRGGARGGGIAREGRHDAHAQVSAGARGDEDTVIRDREHAEKRKRESR